MALVTQAQRSGQGNTRYQPTQNLDQLLRSKANQSNFEGFVPDKAVFDQQIQAQLDQYLSQLPVAQENFNAGLAARGIYSSGEAPKFLYSDVYQPIARAGASAIAQGNVQYAGLQQQGAIAGANLQLGYAGLWNQRDMTQQQIRAQQQSSLWSGIGSLIGTGAGFLLGGPAGAAAGGSIGGGG